MLSNVRRSEQLRDISEKSRQQQNKSWELASREALKLYKYKVAYYSAL